MIMDLRALAVLAGMLAVSAGVSWSRLEREAAFADYDPRTRERLVELSYGWGDGWQKLLRPGPKPQAKAIEDQVHFLLWTRSNPSDEYELEPFNVDNLAASNFDASKNTHLAYHGFSVDGKIQWILDSKDGTKFIARLNRILFHTALLDREDVNFISVDWGELAATANYLLAVDGVYETAEYTASLLEWLAEEVGLDFKKTSLVGHSLGAHCAGMTGNYLTSGSLARVTGLDPAAPLFEDQDAGQRVNSDSADFVDIIHTNSGSLTEGCVGMAERIGQVDFYPNGGAHQPGCLIINSTNVIDLLSACSHGRGPLYWVESISAQEPEDMFWAKPCTDWDSYNAGQCTSCGNGCLQMGYQDDISEITIPSNIQYYLTTNSESPFAQGQS
ncbi:Lipase/vitellogenin [Trinorchestia longiramus]|nr:Lipase/vitellogenin [Trinorchestia longiramus]